MKIISDMELLDAYARQRSEEAFREVVARHADFVYSAALRQLRNPHLAQEVTQSAFIALAEKAGHLRRGTVIAGWLHHATRFAALKLQRSEARRKHWEREAAALNVSVEEANPLQEQALPQIDSALDELAAVDRDALILRFLQQKSLRDVAEALGASEDAAKKRVSRALDKLRSLLTQRGATVSAAALATGLSQLTVNAAPPALPATVAALAGQTAAQAGATGAAAWLAPAKAKLALAAGFILLGGLAILLWPRRPTNNVGTVTATNSVPSAAMKIKLTSVMVDDQDKALKFYTQVLGFVKKQDFPAGAGRWLTVVSSAEPDGTELLLEPMGFAPSRAFQAALFRAGIPMTAFLADDVQREYNRMRRLGVKFTSAPRPEGPTVAAIFEDTCGNRIQLFQPAGFANSTSPAIRLKLTSVMVADQEQALNFYTKVLGFEKKLDIETGMGRWLTVISPGDPDGTQLSLEPTGFASARTYQKALFEAGIPWMSFLATNLKEQHERLTQLGVRFPTGPTATGPTTIAVLDDTCGNLIKLFQP